MPSAPSRPVAPPCTSSFVAKFGSATHAPSGTHVGGVSPIVAPASAAPVNRIVTPPVSQLNTLQRGGGGRSSARGPSTRSTNTSVRSSPRSRVVSVEAKGEASFQNSRCVLHLLVRCSYIVFLLPTLWTRSVHLCLCCMRARDRTFMQTMV